MPEHGVDGADFVEAHLVDQLFEDQWIVGEQIDTPLPIVKADGASDDLFYRSGITAADHAMIVHLACAFFDGELVPVLVFATAAVHGIEAGVAIRRNLG